MPLSDPSHRPWILARLQEQCDLSQVRSVVDAGAGFGGYEGFFKPYMMQARWTAIEIWEPYAERFLFQYRYQQVIIGDLRQVALPEADLYFVGDVLEHMPGADAVRTWDRVLGSCRKAVLSLPVRHYPQGEALGNPHEEHVDHWSVARVQAELAGIQAAYSANADTGAFIADGRLAGPHG